MAQRMHDENRFRQHVSSNVCGVGRDLIGYLTEVWNHDDEIVPKLRARRFQGEALCP